MVQSPYRDQSRACLAQAEEALAKGDLRVASEKGWNAASHMVRAVAEARGWACVDRRMHFEAVDRLVTETYDKDLLRFFGLASELHDNSIEGFLPSATVSGYLEDVALFVERVESVLGEE